MKKLLILFLFSFPSLAFGQYSNGSHNDLKNGRFYGLGMSYHYSEAQAVSYNIIKIGEGGFGYFSEYVRSIKRLEPRDIYSNTISGNYEDNYLDRKDEYISANVGLILAIEKYYGIYFGFGLTYINYFGKYSDPDGIRGNNGEYFVRSSKISSLGINPHMGVIFSLPAYLLLKVGLAYEPSSINVGLSFIIPSTWDIYGR